MSGPLRPGDTLRFEFSLADGDNAAVNGDSLPTASLYRNGTVDGAVTVTVNAAVATGAYNGSCTVPSGYSAGDEVAILVVAVVNTITARIWVEREILVKWPADAFPNVATGNAGAVLTAGAGTAQVAVSGGAVTTVTTATNLTNLPSIPANWITAAGITAGALNGKGDWYTGTPPTASVIAAAVWDLATTGHTTSGTFGAAAVAAGAAGDPWSTTLPGSYGAGTAGNIVGTNLDAAVSSRSTYAGADTSGTTTLLSRLTSTRAGLLDHLDADVSSRMATFSYTAPPTAAAITTAVWTDLLAGADFGTATSIGKLLKDDVDAAISSRSTYAGADTAGTTTLLSRLTSGRATNLDNLDATVSSRSSHSAADVWASGGRTLTAFSFTVSANVTQIAGSTNAATLQAAAAEAAYTGTVTSAPTTTSFRDSALTVGANAINGRIIAFRLGSTLYLQGSTVIGFDPVTHEVTVDPLQPFIQAPVVGDSYDIL